MKIRVFFKNMFLSLLALICFGGIVGVIGVAGLFYWAARDLPTTEQLADFRPPQATTILARDGTPLGSLFHEKRFMVPLELMSKHITKAFLAAEDDSFYQHVGVDPMAIMRAAIVNFRSGRSTQGGSTITQQVIKQVLLTPEKSYKRKLKEAVLAYRLEKELTKDQILSIYLNQIFLGQKAYGVEAAARTYFGKHATDITLAESALLAGMPQAPSRYNPFRYPKAAKERQLYVLRRLRELKWITEVEYQQAVNEPLVYWTMPEAKLGAAGWYMEEVRRLLIEFFSEENMKIMGLKSNKFGEDYVYEAGLTVTTAMDPFHQDSAAAGLRFALEALARRQGFRGPVEKIAVNQINAYLTKKKFSPYDLIGGTWVRGLVTKVEAKGAYVGLGDGYTGYASVSTMRWARHIDPRKRQGYNINDARKVLAIGDVVWFSQPESKPTEVMDKGEKVIKDAVYDPIAVKKNVPIKLALQQMPVAQGALVSIEPDTGDVVALIGGYEFGESHFNRAVQSERQPGSAFKPIVYSAALDKGFTAATLIPDLPFYYRVPGTRSVWAPSNYDHKFRGLISVSSALAASRNVCTVRVTDYIGIQAVIDRAKALGLTPDFPHVLPISLGSVAVSPLNMAQAFTAFAYQGWAARPRIIISIKDVNGREIYKQDPEHWQAVSPENAYIMASLMKKVVTAGTASRARVLNKFVAGKTGTTNEEKDTWFIGFTPQLVSSVYIGYDQLQRLGRGETGGTTALPAFVEYRKRVEPLYPKEDFVRPQNVSVIGGLGFRNDMPHHGTAQMPYNADDLNVDPNYANPNAPADQGYPPNNAYPNAPNYPPANPYDTPQAIPYYEGKNKHVPDEDNKPFAKTSIAIMSNVSGIRRIM